MNFNNDFPGDISQNSDPNYWLPMYRDQQEPLRRVHQGGAENLRFLEPRSNKDIGKEDSLPTDSNHFEGLIAQLSGFGWEKSEEAFRQLDMVGIDECLKALHELRDVSGDGADHVRVAAVEILGSLGKLAPVEPLVVALADSFWDVRAAAAQALGALGERTPVKFLMKMLDHEKDENVREAIVRSLGKQKMLMLIQKFVFLLRHDESWLVRQAASWALGEFGDNAPIKWLSYALHYDDDESVRAAAALSLGQSKKMKVKKFLYEALLDVEEEVREAAQRAIEHLDENIQREPSEEGWPVRIPELHSPQDKHLGISMTTSEPQTNPEIDVENERIPELRSLQDRNLGDARTASEPQTNPEMESIDLLLREQDQSFSTKASPVWGESEQEWIMRILVDFLHDRRGYVSKPRTLETADESIVMFTCFYQYSSVLWEAVLQSVQASMEVIHIETALMEHDEMVGQALQQTFEAWGERTWMDLLVVSFVLPRRAREEKPLRIMVSGMSGNQVRKDDMHVLEQIANTWIASLEEPLVCQHPYDLTDLRIWYQQAPDHPAFYLTSQ
jgi:HEAT repeat protein